MKFPFVFRVFGFVNLLAFIVFLILSITWTFSPFGGIEFVVLTSFITIWLLVAAFFWLFHSKKSYSLLPLVATSLFSFTAFCLYLTFNSNYVHTSSDKMAFCAASGITFIYAAFIVVSIAYKPIKAWRANVLGKLFDPMITSFFVMCLVIAGSVIFYFNNARHFIIVNEGSIYRSNEGDFITDFNSVTLGDAVIIAVQSPPTSFYAQLSFTDDSDLESLSQFSNVKKVKFSRLSSNILRSGESIKALPANYFYMIATFDETSQLRISIKPSEPVSICDSCGVSVLHSVSITDHATIADYFHPDKNAEEPEEESEDDFAEPVHTYQTILEEKDRDVAEGLDHDAMLKLYGMFFTDIGSSEEAVSLFDTNNPTLTIAGTKFGAYENFQSLLSFVPSSLNMFIYSQGDDEGVVNYDLNSGVWKLSGLNYDTKEDIYALPFTHVNPRFVSWIKDYMIPQPKEIILDHTAQQLYDSLFRRTLWELAAAHEYLGDSAFYEFEMREYFAAMDKDGFQGMEYLYQRYNEVNEQTDAFAKMEMITKTYKTNYYKFNAQVAIGFWLRRRIDGSDEAIWDLLVTILQKYDRYPFESSAR